MNDWGGKKNDWGSNCKKEHLLRGGGRGIPVLSEELSYGLPASSLCVPELSDAELAPTTSLCKCKEEEAKCQTVVFLQPSLQAPRQILRDLRCTYIGEPKICPSSTAHGPVKVLRERNYRRRGKREVET